MNNYQKLNLKFNSSTIQFILGPNDRNINLIGDLLKIGLYARNDEIFIENGDRESIDHVEMILNFLNDLINKNIIFSERDITYVVNVLNSDNYDSLFALLSEKKELIRTQAGKDIYPKTFKQKKYISVLEKKDLVFAIGPAGVGKTYLAVCYGVTKLKDGTFKKIILTRPVVEAGESLGFLPGDLKEKIDPYLRPLYDALYDTLGVKQTEDLIAKGVIEIAPLAYMRGRTLENAFIILDEAQNTTVGQMKLFLSRLGFSSQMVITGDVTQVDLANKVTSGLVYTEKILAGLKEIEIIHFALEDVVRHPLVGKILARFENAKD